MRKKDTQEKRIFESNILSIFSAVKEVGRTMYANNLALSLKKETGKNVIVINVAGSTDWPSLFFTENKDNYDTY